MKKIIKTRCRFLDSDEEFDCEFEEIEESKEVILEVYISNNTSYLFQSYYEIIHIYYRGTYFTFFGCQLVKKSNIKTRYDIKGYFKDVLISNFDDIKVKSYSIRLPKYLNYIFESKEFIEDELNYSSKKKININDNLSIQYKSFVTDSKFGNYSVLYELIIYLEFVYTQEVDLEIVYNDLDILKQFFDFNSGIKNYIQPSSIIINVNQNIKVSNKIPKVIQQSNYLNLSLFNNRFFIDAFKDEKKLTGYNFSAFFNFRDKNEEVFTIIKQWYKSEKYRTVYQYYIDCNDWLQGSNRLISNVMFNNKFLNVIQALENYHRIAYGDKTDNIGYEKDFSKNLNTLNQILKKENNDKLKKWICKKLKGVNKEKRDFTLSDRLDFIKDSCDLMKDINIVDFSINSKNKRDSLSHGNINEVFQGRELELYYNYSLLLLLFSIFKTLDIQDEKLEFLYENNFQIFSIKKRIKNLI